MTASRTRQLGIHTVALLLMLGGLSRTTGAQEESAVAVEPAELARRVDLVGKLVVVDDRIRFFQNHPRAGFDELYLRRTSIPFRLPPELRPESAPRAVGVTVQGRLTREGERLYCDVTAFTLQPADQERFDKAVAALPAKDFENRKSWAKWAEKRATDFKDGPLREQAKSVEAEALRIEAETKRITVDAPREWLNLAEEARRRKVAEPDPSALGHRAFQAMIASSTTADELKALQANIERFFPEAAKDQAASAANLAAWTEKYAADPAAAYRQAPVPVRKALDRRLWADVTGKLLESQAAQNVQSALSIVDQAVALVPERPELASKLIDQAQAQAQRNLPSLRLAEVKTVGELLRDRAKKPDVALEFYRDWLKSQRERLSDADAEGSVALAARYEELLRDDQTARELLERAWKIAPGSQEVGEAFVTRGYRRKGDAWVKDSPLADAEVPRPTTEPSSQGLRGKTPDEVRISLATEPSSKSFVGTKGQLIEQWIFIDSRQRRYVNFLHRPGDLKPRVVSDFFLPR